MVIINITPAHFAYFVGIILILTSFFIPVLAITGVSHSWDELTGIPTTASRWPTWDEITSKPAGFSDGVDNAGFTDCTICLKCDLDGGYTAGTERCIGVNDGYSGLTGDTNNNDYPTSDNVQCKIKLTCS
jgi:hypothetical protein